MNKLKTTNGITLIALVITIIVLIILAGVSIAMLTGDNGILTQANKAKEENERAKIVEEIQLTYNEVAIEKEGNISDEKSINELVFQKMQEKGNDIRDKVVSTERITQIKFVDGSGNNISDKISIKVDETKNDIYIAYNSEASTTTEKYIKIEELYYSISLNKGKATLGDTGYKLEDIQSTTEEDEIEIEYDEQYVTASIADIENDKTKDRLVLTGKTETSAPINITVKSKLQPVSAQLSVEVTKKKDYISKVKIDDVNITNEWDFYYFPDREIEVSCEIVEGTEGELTWEIVESDNDLEIVNDVFDTIARIRVNFNDARGKIVIKNEIGEIVGTCNINCIVDCPHCHRTRECMESYWSCHSCGLKSYGWQYQGYCPSCNSYEGEYVYACGERYCSMGTCMWCASINT